MRNAEELKNVYWKKSDDTIAHVPVPSPDDFEDSEALRGWISSEGIVLTDFGYSALEHSFSKSTEFIAPDILKRTRGLILMAQHDTAVREACIIVEDALRHATGSSQHGYRLIDTFFTKALASDRVINSQLKTFRTEVKAVFKFVRNEYMHNLKSISQAQCYSILVRTSRVLSGVREIGPIIAAD